MRTYTRAELEEVARMAAGMGAGAVMAKVPDVVMPTEDVLDGVQAVLADFDERRGSALGYRAEQNAEQVESRPMPQVRKPGTGIT